MDDLTRYFTQMRTGPFRGMLDPNMTAMEHDGGGIHPHGFVDNFDSYLAKFIQTGIYNATFGAAPQAPASNLHDETNILPGWRGPISASGSAITARWTQESDGTAKVVFTVASGAAGDNAYIEQIVPIAASRDRTFAFHPHSYWADTTGNGSLEVYVYRKFLRADGTVIAEAGDPFAGLTNRTFTLLGSGSTLGSLSFEGVAPADAAYIRVRFGVRRGSAATSATGTVGLFETRLAIGYPELRVVDLTDPTRGEAILTVDDGLALLVADSGITLDASNEVKLITNAARIEVLGADERIVSGGAQVWSVSNPTISANQNNWAPTGIAGAGTILCVVSGATRTVTGITAGHHGRILHLMVGGGNDLILAHQSASSTAANRIVIPGAANLTIRNGGGVTLVYWTDRWFVQIP